MPPVHPDFAKARQRMVDRQLRARGIRSERILAAMERVPRHRFMPLAVQRLAYEDQAVAIGEGQTISQPYMVALMTELLDLEPGDRVLEIGAGSGYQTAILAEIAQRVVTIERQPVLARRAKETLAQLGYRNVTVVVGDGTQGYPKEAPYDAIIVTAGGPRIPEPLGTQLAPGGRLVCPVGTKDVQDLVRVVRTPEGLKQERSIRCCFVPLIGEEGWNGGGR